MAKSRFDQREKRRFIEMASIAYTTQMQHLLPTERSPRSIVNKASELYDEIDHQFPQKDED